MTQATLRPFYGGWRPSPPDKRDLYYQLPPAFVLPEVVDWRTEYKPPVLDQDGLGSCTAFAGKYALDYAHHFQGLLMDDFSELFLYYNIRRLEHSTDYDAGGYMRDIPKALKKWGMSTEILWPYDVTAFDVMPSAQAYKDARTDRIIRYERVRQDRLHLQTCLAQRRVFMIGISVYESFLTDSVARSGIVPMPDLRHESVQGGHALCFLGYDNTRKVYYGINSWGEGWGNPLYPGCFEISYDYLEDIDLAGDCWTMTLVR